MKTTMKSLMAGGLIATAMMLFISCENEQMDADNAMYASIIDVAGDGVTTINEGNLKSTLVETPALNSSELTILIHMKEEEKLARDVYSVLCEKWGSQIFSRISVAEDRHMNAVITLLKYYDATDTLVGEPGVFSSTEIQALYNELVVKGSVSVKEAMMTGALIEEMDIKDLTDALDVVTNENIIRVFENLLKGSRNHLRAFNKQLTNLGLVYAPVYISQEEYDTIVNNPMERGDQYRIQNRANRFRNGNGYGRGNNQGNGNCSGDGNNEGTGNGEGQGNQGGRNGRG